MSHRANTERGRRLRGVDAARGVALAGMAATHILPFETDGDVNELVQLFSGRASALFAVLAGVGLALATGGSTPLRGRELWGARGGVIARALVVVAVGLYLADVDSPPAVILVYYGLFFLLALPFLGLRTPALVILAAVWAFAAPAVSLLLRRDIGDPSLEEVRLGMPLVTAGEELLLTGYYPALPWAAYLLAGLAVGRLPLRSPRVAASVAGAGLALAVAGKAISAFLLGPLGGREELVEAGPIPAADLDAALGRQFYGNVPTESFWWLATSNAHSASPFDLLHTTGSALLVLGIALLVGTFASALLWPLAAFGSMTLTLYSLHVLALGPDGPTADPWPLYRAHLVAGFVIALLWRSFVGRGPLEAVAAAADRGVRRWLRKG